MPHTLLHTVSAVYSLKDNNDSDDTLLERIPESAPAWKERVSSISLNSTNRESGDTFSRRRQHLSKGVCQCSKSASFTIVHSFGVRLTHNQFPIETDISTFAKHHESQRSGPGASAQHILPITTAQVAPVHSVGRQDVPPGYPINDTALRSLCAAVALDDFSADNSSHSTCRASGS